MKKLNLLELSKKNQLEKDELRLLRGGYDGECKCECVCVPGIPSHDHNKDDVKQSSIALS